MGYPIVETEGDTIVNIKPLGALRDLDLPGRRLHLDLRVSTYSAPQPKSSNPHPNRDYMKGNPPIQLTENGLEGTKSSSRKQD